MILVKIIAFLFFIQSYSQQELLGRYSTFEGPSIEFQENNRFSYVYSSCLSKTSGVGKFEFKKDSLKLIFDKIDQPKRNSVEILKIKATRDSLITLNFKAFDENDFPLPVNISRKVKGEQYYLDLIVYNEKSKSYQVDKDNKIYEYCAELVGYDPVKFEIDHLTSKEITLKLYQSFYRIISNETIEMSWVKIDSITYESNLFRKFIKK